MIRHKVDKIPKSARKRLTKQRGDKFPSDKSILLSILEESDFKKLCRTSGRPTIYCQTCGVRAICPRVKD